MIKELIELADRLDEAGYHKEAEQVDALIKQAGLGDMVKEWFMGKPMPKCTCECEDCAYARDAVGRPQLQLQHHKKCSTGDCEVKNQVEGK
jgi:hypothetical protein